MGTRYVLEMECEKCGVVDDDVYFAPTCGFVEWQCICGHVVNLSKHTGISHEEASNINVIENTIKDMEIINGKD
jgi:hypothetical protein